MNRLAQIYIIKIRLIKHECTSLSNREHWMKRTVCANKNVCEEEQQATLHREFLGGSKISYSTPHSREAHTHTNLD